MAYESLWHAIPRGVDKTRPNTVLLSAAVSPVSSAKSPMPDVWKSWPDSVNNSNNHGFTYWVRYRPAGATRWADSVQVFRTSDDALPDLWAAFFPEAKAGSKQPFRAPQPNVNYDLPPVTYAARDMHRQLSALRGTLLMQQVIDATVRAEGPNAVKEFKEYANGTTFLDLVQETLRVLALVDHRKPNPAGEGGTRSSNPKQDFKNWVAEGLASSDQLMKAKVIAAERNLYRLSPRPYDQLKPEVFTQILQTYHPDGTHPGSASSASTLAVATANSLQQVATFHGRSSAPPPRCSELTDTVAIQSAARSNNVVTLVTATPHRRNTDDPIVAQGLTDAAANGIFACTKVNDTKLSYQSAGPNAADLGAGGTVSLSTKPTYDWAQKISLLGNYPYLLRPLGLVIDFWAPAPPSFTGEVQLIVKHPTSQANSSSTFIDKDFFAASSPQPVLTHGALNIDNGEYALIDMDLDGAALKTLQAADSSARSHEKYRSSRSAELERDPSNALPANRSAGLALVHDAHAKKLLDKYKDDKAKRDKLESNPDPVPLFADDLVRGYIPEVKILAGDKKDTCGAKKDSGWLSLTLRNEVFRGLNLPKPPGEPQHSILRWAATTTNDTPGGQHADASDLHIHEVLFRWRGWSLGVPMPLSTIDSCQCTSNPDKPFPFDLETSVPDGTLPPLRFGKTYAVRVRTMDMACQLSPDAADLPVSKQKFLRHDPVAAPVVLLEQPINTTNSPGEGAELLVLRDGTNDKEKDAPDPVRTLVPPRVNLEMAELMGYFDHGKTPFSVGSFEAVKFVVTPDPNPTQPCAAPPFNCDFPKDGSGNALYQTPERFPPPGLYYPDPLADSAAFELIDFTSGAKTSKLLDPLSFYRADDWPKAGRCEIKLMDDSSVSTGVQEVSFERRGDYLGLGNEAVQRLLIGLPRGWKLILRLRSGVDKKKKCLLAATDELFDASGSLLLQTLFHDSSGPQTSRFKQLVKKTKQYADKYAVDMHTPPRELTLIHAVVRPLLNPAITSLCGQRKLADPGFDLAVEVAADRKSTGRINIQADWIELDDCQPGDFPKTRPTSAHVDAQPPTRVPPPAAAQTRQAFIGVPEQPLDGEDPRKRVRIDGAPDPAHPFHHTFHQVFPDTRHRYVTYSAVGTSRFQHFYADQTDQKRFQLRGTKDDEVRKVHVLSTSRPPAPDIAYVVPLYGWEKQKTSRRSTSKRVGGGLRIYLRRPWFQSGEEEKLGIVLWGEPAQQQVLAPTEDMDSCQPLRRQDFNADPDRKTLRQFVTRWGADPTRTDSVDLLAPDSSMFCEVKPPTGGKCRVPEIVHGLSLEEIEPSPAAGSPDPRPRYPVALVTYEPMPDPIKRLWYCDVKLNYVPAYSCFVRLALVRYQPFSLRHTECSHVAIATFAQLPAERSVMLERKNSQTLTVTVRGTRPGDSALSKQDTKYRNEMHFIVEHTARSPVCLESAAEVVLWPAAGGSVSQAQRRFPC
jgi:hypothetical protein